MSDQKEQVLFECAHCHEQRWANKNSSPNRYQGKCVDQHGKEWDGHHWCKKR